MADISAASWSEADANNNSASPNGWTSATMLPSQVEPTARAMMGAIKRWYDHAGPSVSSGGTANAQTLTYGIAPAAYVRGDAYVFIAGLTNTGATTLNINGLATIPILIGAAALSGSEILAGTVTAVYYDGTNFQLFRAREPNGQLIGTRTNDDAGIGVVGEYFTNFVASGSAVALASGVISNVTSIPLTPGDWEVFGQIEYRGGATTTVSYTQAAISTANNTTPDQASGLAVDFYNNAAVFGATAILSQALSPVRVSIAANATYYLNAQAVFGVSTMNAYGSISARRVR